MNREDGIRGRWKERKAVVLQEFFPWPFNRWFLLSASNVAINEAGVL